MSGEGDPARTAIAEFLRGRRMQLPPDPLGCVIPRAQVLLYQGRTADAWHGSQPVRLYEMIGWEDDRSRCRLLQAEAACRMSDPANTRRLLEEAARWVLRSGSVEHLCLYHLVRSRIARKACDLHVAERAVDEGVHLARQCGLGLYHVELLCVQAEQLLDTDETAAAGRSAGEALRLASAPESHFAWGAAAAGRLLGRSLLAQDRRGEARPVLEKA